MRYKLGNHLKAVAKALSWRGVGAMDSLVLSSLIVYWNTGHWNLAVAGSFVGAELFTKTVLYYAHERAWERSWARNFFN